MMASVTITEKTVTGKAAHQLEVEIPSETITVRELIRSHVYQLVRENSARTASRQAADATSDAGFVPSPIEEELNGPRRLPPPEDWQKQLDRTLRAFRSHQIILLVDGHQVTSLDDTLQLEPRTEICFLRLTMLTGG